MRRAGGFTGIFRRAGLLIRHKMLVPAKRFLTLQHFTGIILLLYALSMATQPTAPITALAKALNFAGLPLVGAMAFTFFGALLVGKAVSETRYRLYLLPLFMYFAATLWYVTSAQPSPTTGQASSWGGAISSFAVWGFFNIAGTQLPQQDGDHDAGSS